MIITCPECTTRYDVDDERFSSAGRSVRCTACGEAWFVPAPELIDVDPIEELTPAKRPPLGAYGGKSQRRGGEEKGHFEDAPRAVQGRGDRSTRSQQDSHDQREDFVDDVDFDEDEDDSLFGPPSKEKPDSAREAHVAGENAEPDADRGGFHGFGFGGRRFGRSKGRDEDDSDGQQNEVDDGAPSFIKHQSRKERAQTEGPDERESLDARDDIVDADWEAVDNNAAEKSLQSENRTPTPEIEQETKKDASGDRRRGFGRRASDHQQTDAAETVDRRSAGAEIAKLADVSPFDPEEFDEEFFTSLRVTPKALARALKKTRRRSESRQKNRLTPFRALGWTIWLAAVVGGAYGVFAFRDEIVKIAPKTADAYAIVGIEANPFGLAIENVEHRLAMSTAGPTIEISGKLKNKGDKPVASPLLQAEALGPRGELLSRWTFSPTDPEVLEGATIDFITRAPAPDGVAEVALSFAPTKSPVSELLSGRE